MTIKLVVGDCREVMREMEANSIDAICTDPPYGLEFMGKEWDSFKTGRSAKYSKGGDLDIDNIKAQSGKGGAGPSYVNRPARRCAKCGKQSWSGSPCKCEQPEWTIDNSPLHAAQSWHEAWAREAYRVLKPGGHMLAFGGTRTHHRLMVAIEDAGFEIRDTLMWLYASGFPKSHDISKAIDKAAGAEREVVGVSQNGVSGKSIAYDAGNDTPRKSTEFAPAFNITAPATDAAKQWEGFGTALKPSLEPVVLAAKPFNVPGDRAIIDGILSTIAEGLCERTAKNAAENSRHTPRGSSGAKGDSVPTPAQTNIGDSHKSETLTGAAVGTSSEVGTSASTSAAVNIALNTISLWRLIWADACDAVSTYTTETVSSLITDLKTWSLSLSQITPECMLRAVLNPSGANVPVSDAVALSNAVAEKLNAIQLLIAPAPASKESPFRPDFEPIILARKPLIGSVAANVLRYGTGGINVDATRIEYQSAADRSESEGKNQHTNYKNPNSNRDSYSGDYPPRTDYDGSKGRWPANLILGCQCPGDAHEPECAVAMLDAQSGERGDSFRPNAQSKSYSMSGDIYSPRADKLHHGGFPGSGGASRFFFCAKSSRAERNKGLEGMPERFTATMGNGIGVREHDPENPRAHTQNHHPTVKPLSLMQWLVKLITPPGGTVLDCFGGSGSTMVAADREGFHGIYIDSDSEYARIAAKRCQGDAPLFSSVSVEREGSPALPDSPSIPQSNGNFDTVLSSFQDRDSVSSGKE